MKEEVEYKEGRQFRVDASKVENIEDIKLILGFMDLHFTPQSKEDYEKTKHFLKPITNHGIIQSK